MKKPIAGFLSLMLLVLPLNLSWAAGARARVMIDRLIEEKRDPSRAIEMERRMESEQRQFESQLLRLMRRRSGLVARELDMVHLREYVSKHQSHIQNLDALAEVLQNITARGNVIPAEQEATANLLAKAIKMSERGEFSLEPRDILEIDRSWRVLEKDGLADVLTEARTLIEENPTLTADQALEKALENRGLLEPFNKRCR